MIHDIERDLARATMDLIKTQASIEKDLNQLHHLSDKIRQRNPILNERLELDSLTTAGAQSMTLRLLKRAWLTIFKSSVDSCNTS